jgi:hypothetical protein
LEITEGLERLWKIILVNNKELPHSAVMQKWFDNTWLYAGKLHLFGVISREDSGKDSREPSDTTRRAPSKTDEDMVHR